MICIIFPYENASFHLFNLSSLSDEWSSKLVQADHSVTAASADSQLSVMITYNIYIVIRETGQFSSKGIINDFIGNLNRLTVSRRFTEQAV